MARFLRGYAGLLRPLDDEIRALGTSQQSAVIVVSREDVDRVLIRSYAFQEKPSVTQL